MQSENTTRADDDVCLCFHVSKRKIVNFIRVEKPVRVSQISQCLGAGTGCGWCRPVLEKLFEKVTAAGTDSGDGSSAGPESAGRPPLNPIRIDGFSDLSLDDYACQRKAHIARTRDAGHDPETQAMDD